MYISRPINALAHDIACIVDSMRRSAAIATGYVEFVELTSAEEISMYPPPGIVPAADHVTTSINADGVCEHGERYVNSRKAAVVEQEAVSVSIHIPENSYYIAFGVDSLGDGHARIRSIKGSELKALSKTRLGLHEHANHKKRKA